MNDVNRMHFENFPKDAFEVFINCLETQGFVIDSKTEQDYAFSSTQLDNMTREVFKNLIEKFSIDTEFDYDEDFSRSGTFRNTHGGYSIIFNNKKFDLYEANKVLNDYIDSI